MTVPALLRPLLFLFLLIGWKLGWIQPHGVS